MVANGTAAALDPAAMKRHAGSAAKLVRALSNKHRLLVLCVLSKGELSVGELNDRVRLSQSALSQHLAVLRRERLVSTRRSAQTIYYRLTGGIAMDLIRVLHAHYCGLPARAVTSTAGRARRNGKAGRKSA